MKLLLKMMLSVLLVSMDISGLSAVAAQPEVQDISGRRVSVSVESLSGPGIFLIVKEDSGIVFWTLSDAKALLANLATDKDVDARLTNLGIVRNFLAERNPLVTDVSKHRDILDLFKRFSFEPKKLSDFGSRWGIALPTVMSDVFDVAEQSIQAFTDLSVIHATGDTLILSECSDAQRAAVLAGRSSGHSRFPFLYVLPEAGLGQKNSIDAKRSPSESQPSSSMGVVGGVIAGVVTVAGLVWRSMKGTTSSDPKPNDDEHGEADVSGSGKPVVDRKLRAAPGAAAALKPKQEAEAQKEKAQELERPHSVLLESSQIRRPKVEHRSTTPPLPDEEDAGTVVAEVLKEIVQKIENQRGGAASPFRPVVSPKPSSSGHEASFAGSDDPPITSPLDTSLGSHGHRIFPQPSPLPTSRPVGAHKGGGSQASLVMRPL